MVGWGVRGEGVRRVEGAKELWRLGGPPQIDPGICGTPGRLRILFTQCFRFR